MQSESSSAKVWFWQSIILSKNFMKNILISEKNLQYRKFHPCFQILNFYKKIFFANFMYVCFSILIFSLDYKLKFLIVWSYYMIFFTFPRPIQLILASRSKIVVIFLMRIYIQCILRFVNFSFPEKVLTNRVLLTNRVKVDKSGQWGISFGLNLLV